MTASLNRGPGEERVTGLASLTVGNFIERLASSDPTPGGGAAAAVIGAIAASLVAMVAELSTGRTTMAAYEQTIRRSGAVGRRTGGELIGFADEDATAFDAFMAAWRAPRDGAPGDRRLALGAVARRSIEPPRSILGCCVIIADAAARLAGGSNPNLASALMVASRAVEAAAQCAAANVLVNLPHLADPQEAEGLQREARKLFLDTERLARETRRGASTGSVRPRESGEPRPGAREPLQEGPA